MGGPESELAPSHGWLPSHASGGKSQKKHVTTTEEEEAVVHRVWVDCFDFTIIGCTDSCREILGEHVGRRPFCSLLMDEEVAPFVRVHDELARAFSASVVPCLRADCGPLHFRVRSGGTLFKFQAFCVLALCAEDDDLFERSRIPSSKGMTSACVELRHISSLGDRSCNVDASSDSVTEASA